MNQPRSGRRPWVRVLVLAAAVVVAPLPVFAGDGPVTKPGPGIAASASKAVADAARQSTGSARMSQAQDAPRTDLSSPSFFKSPAGIITLIVVGVGVGATLYSTSNDRVKSPGK